MQISATWLYRYLVRQVFTARAVTIRSDNGSFEPRAITKSSENDLYEPRETIIFSRVTKRYEETQKMT